MRLLNPDRQLAIVKASNEALERILPDSNTDLKMRIISGEEEGFFGWLSVNYLMDGFVRRNKSKNSHHTWGFLDMGGASTQIAFEPKRGWGDGIPREEGDGLIDFKLRMTDGSYHDYTVFVATWLGYGTNKARERHMNHIVKQKLLSNDRNHNYNGAKNDKFSEYNDIDDDDDSLRIPNQTFDESHIINDPCLPLNLDINDYQNNAIIHGTGSFPNCLRSLEPLLEREAFCPHPPCLFGGQRVPPIDFTLDRFVGVSEYWFSSEHVFGLGGAWDLVRFERAADEYCSKDWSKISEDYENGKINGVSGKWGDQVDLDRLRMQCFKASWIVEVLHQGIGIPRIVDPGGNVTSHGEPPSVKGKEKAEQKGLAPVVLDDDEPIFQSVNSVNFVPISWTLGSVLLTASGSLSPFININDKDNIKSNNKFNNKIFNFTNRFSNDFMSSSDILTIIFVILAVFVVIYILYRVYKRRRKLKQENDHLYTTIPNEMEEGNNNNNTFVPISLNDLNDTRGKPPLMKYVNKFNKLLKTLKTYSPFKSSSHSLKSRTPKLRVSSGGLSQPLQHTASSPAVMSINQSSYSKSVPNSPKRPFYVNLSDDSNINNDHLDDDNNRMGLGLFRSLSRSSSNLNSSINNNNQNVNNRVPFEDNNINNNSLIPSNNSNSLNRASLSSRNSSSVNLTTLVSRSTSSAKLNNLQSFSINDEH